MTMVARCHHPNLLRFIGATNKRVAIIVTETMYTGLKKILEHGQLSSDQIIPITTGVACGLNYLQKSIPQVPYYSIKMLAVLLFLTHFHVTSGFPSCMTLALLLL